jgi:hypothetical protein
MKWLVYTYIDDFASREMFSEFCYKSNPTYNDLWATKLIILFILCQ